MLKFFIERSGIGIKCSVVITQGVSDKTIEIDTEI